MKSWVIYLVGFSSILFACSSVQKEKHNCEISNVVDGIVLITQKACFFVPLGNCDNIVDVDSEEGTNMALIVDHLEEEDRIKSYNPIIANIIMLPNKDSTGIIVWLDRCHFDYIKKGECYIIPAKVKLTTHHQPIDYLSFLYNLRFCWKDVTYNYKCIYKGNPIHCQILSLNEYQQQSILNAQSLPVGKESD